MKTIAIAAVQLASEPGKVAANQRLHEQWIDRAVQAGADLVMFPECSLTGYATKDPFAIAIDAQGPEALALEDFARQRGIALAYGFVEVCGEVCSYITYVVSDGSAHLAYRKAHLGKVESAFTAGNNLPVEEVAGVRIGVQQCWESHIPDIAATLRGQDVQVILTPYAQGTAGQERIDAWNKHLPARASDNGVFVVACNMHLPEGKNGRTGGGVAAWAPDGSMLGSYGGDGAHMEVFSCQGLLPRENKDGGMRTISYYDCRRPELYR